MPDIIDPLIPPYRFERIQAHLYRGGYPKPRNFRFLRRQRLKTIVSLIPPTKSQTNTIIQSFDEFCQTENIERIIIHVDSPNENVTVTESIVSQCLELITDPSRRPLYLHCLDGSNVTGLVVMCLRKLQLWRVASYQSEYIRLEQEGEIIPEESEFVEMYQGKGLCLVNPYAGWLWPGRSGTDGRLPFPNGRHPVLPYVTLREPTQDVFAEEGRLPGLSRSATDPAAVSEDQHNGSEEDALGIATTNHTMEPQQSQRQQSEAPGDKRRSYISHTRVPSNTSNYSNLADGRGLHMSFSTSALADIAPLNGAHDEEAFRQKNKPAASQDTTTSIQEILAPVLATLVSQAKPTAATTTRSSPVQVARVERDGLMERLARRSIGEEAADNVASAEDGSAVPVVKKVNVSGLVQALAIEGLGM